MILSAYSSESGCKGRAWPLPRTSHGIFNLPSSLDFEPWCGLKPFSCTYFRGMINPSSLSILWTPALETAECQQGRSTFSASNSTSSLSTARWEGPDSSCNIMAFGGAPSATLFEWISTCLFYVAYTRSKMIEWNDIFTLFQPKPGFPWPVKAMLWCRKICICFLGSSSKVVPSRLCCTPPKSWLKLWWGDVVPLPSK